MLISSGSIDTNVIYVYDIVYQIIETVNQIYSCDLYNAQMKIWPARDIMVLITYWQILLLSADVVELAMSLHIYPYFVMQVEKDMWVTQACLGLYFWHCDKH